MNEITLISEDSKLVLKLPEIDWIKNDDINYNIIKLKGKNFIFRFVYSVYVGYQEFEHLKSNSTDDIIKVEPTKSVTDDYVDWIDNQDKDMIIWIKKFIEVNNMPKDNDDISKYSYLGCILDYIYNIFSFKYNLSIGKFNI